MKRISLFITLILISSCDFWLQQIEEMKNEYENFQFHENGVDTSIPHNAEMGRIWMDKTFYASYPMTTPELPNGCSEFDRVYYVAPIGDDNNPGNLSTPFASIQKAIDNSKDEECTLIRVLNGRYNKTFSINNKKNITVFGSNRITTQILSKTILDDWENVSKDECKDLLNCTTIKKTISGSYSNKYHLLYKDKISIPMVYLGRLSFREVITAQDLINPELLTSATLINEIPNITISDNLSELTDIGKENFKNHIIKILETDTSALRYMVSNLMLENDLSWEGIGSAYYVHPTVDENGNPTSTIYFRNFDNELFPGDHLSTHSGYNAFIIDSQNVVIQNLSLYNGKYGVAIKRNSNNIKVIGNLLKSNYRSVYVIGDQAQGIKYAPSNIEIFGNQITNNLDLNNSPQFKGAYRNFILPKIGFSDAHGVYILEGGSNINVHHNFIYNVANGVQSWNVNISDYQTIDLKVHHNLIINTIDDALEPGGTCINCKWYSNHIRNSSQAIRLKIENINSIGPVFIYNNVIYNQDKYDFISEQNYSNQTTFYYHTANEVPTYVYNNLFLGFRCLMMPTSNTELGGPNLYFLNNIFSCRFSFPNATLGYWPSFLYPLSEQVTDPDGNPIAMETSKNLQPLFSNNWIGGIKDPRTSVISSSGNYKALYENEKMYIFTKNEHGDDLNQIFKAEVNETPVHFFDSFDKDETHILNRTDFCLNRSPFIYSLSNGINTSNSDDLVWDFTEELLHGNRFYFHHIYRTIDISLPHGDSNQGRIGPNELSSNECENLKWLLNDF